MTSTTMEKLGVVWGASRPPGVRVKTLPPGLQTAPREAEALAAAPAGFEQPGASRRS